ncbi:MAG: ROK family protein, partial [Oscillospiraceae bacterium]
MKFYIGVDLGGTKTAAGLVNEKFEIIAKDSCPTGLPCPHEDVEKNIANLCKSVCEKGDIDINAVEWIGVGAPGSVNGKSGIVAFSANFAYENWTLKKNLENLLPRPVFIENDANAAAYGEYVAGALKGTVYSIAVTLGTGIGSGVIIHGQLFSGYNSSGAELGHMVIEKGGRQCMCGRKGCYEKYASARALTEDTVAEMKKNPDNVMWKIANGSLENVNAKTAFDAMRQGDPLAKKIIHNFVEYVACGLTNIINIFQPEIICIGGGISKEGDVLL